jgi:uncharacterized membrane protein
VRYLLFFHIVFTLLFVSGIVMASAAEIKMSKSKDLKEIAILFGLGEIASKFLIYPSVVLIGLTGWLAAWRIGYPLTGTGWLIASYIVTVVAVVISVSVLGRHSRKMAGLIADAEKQGRITDALVAAKADRVPMMTSNVLNVLLVFLLVLMVFRPF